MILAIDLGGTKLQYAIFNEAYGQERPLETFQVPTQKNFLSQLKDAVLDCTARYSAVSVVAIGVPGPTYDNVMQGSRPLNCVQNVNFSQALAQFNLPLIIRNDLHMAAHCELYQGVGQEHKNFCLVSFSTGIGVAAVNNGIILEGRIEMGHQIFFPDFAPPQPCTNHQNCWAALASGNGIENRFGTDQHNTTTDIFTHVLTDADLSELQQINAQAFGNLINAYDPEIIVVMGSLGIEQFDLIMPAADQVEKYSINRPIPTIIRSTSGNDIGLTGAYYAARNALIPTSEDEGKQ